MIMKKNPNVERSIECHSKRQNIVFFHQLTGLLVTFILYKLSEANYMKTYEK
jgi:hypothetical protein